VANAGTTLALLEVDGKVRKRLDPTFADSFSTQIRRGLLPGVSGHSYVFLA